MRCFCSSPRGSSGRWSTLCTTVTKCTTTGSRSTTCSTDTVRQDGERRGCPRQNERLTQIAVVRALLPTQLPGMQTWEYSAAYALRSWWYIVLHKMIGWPVAVVLGDQRQKVAVFYAIKMGLGLLTAAAEYSLCDALVKRVNPHVGKVYLVLSVFSSGMLVSANAFLPSSLAMVAITFCAAGVLRGNPRDVIAGAVVGSAWGWIVAGLAFLPYTILRYASQSDCWPSCMSVGSRPRTELRLMPSQPFAEEPSAMTRPQFCTPHPPNRRVRGLVTRCS